MSGRGTGFRLLTEPASLKPLSFGSLTHAAVMVFPAPHRAGLIEAPGARTNGEDR